MRAGQCGWRIGEALSGRTIMNTSHFRNLNVVYAATAATAVACWLLGLYIPAAILLLLGGGVAVARPHIDGTRLILDGTPVLLLFAVMFIAASSMVVAVDRVSAMFNKPETNRCTTVSSRYASILTEDG